MDEKSRIIEFYNKKWMKNNNPKKNVHFSFRLKKIMKSIKIIYKKKKKKLDILEIGCGRGNISYNASKYGSTIGIDLTTALDENYWKELEKSSPNLKLISGDFLEVDFKNNKFDIIIASEVIEHIKYSNQSKMLRKIYNLLKPNGFLIITTPNGEYVLKTINKEERQPIEDQLSINDLNDLVEKQFFKILEHYSFFPDILNEKNFYYSFCKKFHLLRLIYFPLIWKLQIKKYSNSIHIYQFLLCKKT